MDFEQQNQEESGINLSDAFRIIRVNWMLITVFTLIAAIGTAIFVYAFVPNQYKSTSEVLVIVPLLSGGEEGGINYSDSRSLIRTAAEFVRSDHVVNNARMNFEESDLVSAEHKTLLDGMSDSQVKNGISVSSFNDSFIIRISFTSTDKDFSREMANSITSVVISTQVDLFKDKFFELSAAGIPQDDSPNKILYIIVGMIGGVVSGIAVAFIKQLFNNAYMTKEQLELGTGIQVIGVIPEFEVKERKS